MTWAGKTPLIPIKDSINPIINDVEGRENFRFYRLGTHFDGMILNGFCTSAGV